jgi:hypothetical protein
VAAREGRRLGDGGAAPGRRHLRHRRIRSAQEARPSRPSRGVPMVVLRAPRPTATATATAGDRDGAEVRRLRRHQDTAVEVRADGATHALQHLRGPAQESRGTVGGAEAATAPAGDGDDRLRPAATAAAKQSRPARASSRGVPIVFVQAPRPTATGTATATASVRDGAEVRRLRRHQDTAVEVRADGAAHALQHLLGPAQDAEVRRLRRHQDTAVEVRADGAVHTLQHLRGPAQESRGAVGEADTATAPAGDGDDRL